MAELVPFDRRDGVIWMNGALVPWSDATVHVLNHGLHYASCVFEGVRVYGGTIFKNEAHNRRLHNSAKLLGFEVPYAVEALNAACEQVVAEQGIVDGYIRPFAWRGSEQMAILTNLSSVHVAIAAWQWPSYFGAEAREKGLKLTVSKWQRPSPATAPSASKAAGLYMICTLSKNAAVDAGFDDALMMDYRGLVAEATGANVFFVMDGALHTPTADCFLNGITRQTVIGLAQDLGYEVVERAISPEEISMASEAFLTGSAAEVTPIGSVEGVAGEVVIDHQMGVGEVTRALMDAYTELVNR